VFQGFNCKLQEDVTCILVCVCVCVCARYKYMWNVFFTQHRISENSHIHNMK
jgi:hypothetical protein